MEIRSRILLSAPVFLALFLLAEISFSTISSKSRVTNLRNSSLAAEVHAEHLIKQSNTRFPQEWIETAFTLARLGPEHDEMAITLLERALDQSPYDANGWATLSFLRTRTAGKYTTESAQALERSFLVCGYCDRNLIKWRFTYVLHHWDNADEFVRMSAFRGADFLRWWYLEYVFLRQVKEEAERNGIPFDSYRQAVNSPVRSNEVQ